ncbi:MAG: dockerin type I repeat-containing protein [Oscillospiraceae bacterium]|nr:dockerin type I repeat-containing protein [Oscillospiraceae bacterium]
MKKQHLTSALTSAFCLLACSVSAAAALTAYADNSPAEPAVTTEGSTAETVIVSTVAPPEEVTAVKTTMGSVKTTMGSGKSYVSASLWMEDLPDKVLYLPGQELDLKGAYFNGGGTEYRYDAEYGTGEPVYFDYFRTALTKRPDMVDASEFDNTKPGTYTIYVADKHAKTSFEVKVIPKESGDVNGDKNVTVADAVILARVAAEDTAVTITEDGKKYGDIDQDGSLTPDDLTNVLKIIANLF